MVPILLIANLFLGIFIYLSQWYKQTGKTLYGAYISLAGAFITLAVNFIFIPYYGYMASAWATLACYFFMAAASWILGQRHYPVAYQTGRIVFYLASAIGIYFISNYTRDHLLGGWGINAYILNVLFIFAYILLFIYLEKPAMLLKIRARGR